MTDSTNRPIKRHESKGFSKNLGNNTSQATLRPVPKLVPKKPDKKLVLPVVLPEKQDDDKTAIQIKLEKALGLPLEGSLVKRRQKELLALAQESDPDKFIDDKIAFCRRYGWNRQEVDQRIRQLKSSTTAPKAKLLTGKDFFASEIDSISWILPGILPSPGVFILGGQAGVGKTTLAIDMIGAVLLKEDFLGEKPLKPGKVLFIAGDELSSYTQEKLIDRGISGNDDLSVLLNWDVSQWDVLEKAIAEIRPVLVVIDSFSSIHRDPSFDENCTQAKSTIYDLEHLSGLYSFGCVLIHHLSKSKDNQGVAKLRGSSALAAAASVVCIMERNNDTCKLSFPKMRGAQTKPFSVELDEPTGRFQVISGGDDIETKSLGDRILPLLSKDPCKLLEPGEIAAALGLPFSEKVEKDSVYQALKRLYQRGLIIKKPSKQDGKRKLYGVANPSQLSHTKEVGNSPNTVEDTPEDIPKDTPPLPRLNVSVKSSESIDIQGIEETDKLTDSIPDALLTSQDEAQTASDSNEGVEGNLTS
jgi:DNA-binding transcriptional ArsR family regulator